MLVDDVLVGKNYRSESDGGVDVAAVDLGHRDISMVCADSVHCRRENKSLPQPSFRKKKRTEPNRTEPNLGQGTELVRVCGSDAKVDFSFLLFVL